MTEPNLLKRAKEGDPDSIASLMNHSLKSKGIHARVSAAGDRLLVQLESDTPPEQTLLTRFVHNGIQNLGVASIRTVEVSGKASTSQYPAWTSTFHLGNETIEPAVSRPAPPPPRVAAPPPPPRPTPVATPPDETPLELSDETVMVEDGITTPQDDELPIAPSPESQMDSGSYIAPPVEEATAPELPEMEVGGDRPLVEESDSLNNGVPTIPSDQSLERSDSPADRLDAPPTMGAEGDAVDEASDWVTDTERETSDLYGMAEADDPLDDSLYASSSTLDEVDDPLGGSESIPESDSIAVGDDELTGEAGSPPPSEPSSARKTSVSGSPILLIGVALVVIGALGGLIGYSLWSYLANGGSMADPPLIPPPQPEAPSEETTSDGTGAGDAEPGAETPGGGVIAPEEALQEATEKAESATTLAQTAQSGDDWDLIARQWQRAIALLETIPADSPEYNTAQQNLATYRNSLAAAQQQATTRSNVADTPLPSTVITVFDDVNCSAIAPTNESQAVELSNVQFTSSDQESPTRQIVGCLTNHGAQPITSVALDYSGTAPDAPDTPVTGQGNLQFSDLAPGATVPFRGTIELPPNIATIEIGQVTWTTTDSPEPQSAEISIPLQGG